MKYHAVSTSRAGHGAIFTNIKDAREYQKTHPGSVYQVLDHLPAKIPSIGKTEPAGPARIPEKVSGAITVYTDGSALNNPGPGGYGVIIQINGDTLEYSRGYKHTTNNRMEMMAVITALENLKGHTDKIVTIHSDSQYTINGITRNWARNWRKKGWKSSCPAG